MPDALALAGLLLVALAARRPHPGRVPAAVPGLVGDRARDTSRSSAPIAGRGGCSTRGSCSRRSAPPAASRRSPWRWAATPAWRRRGRARRRVRDGGRAVVRRARHPRADDPRPRRPRRGRRAGRRRRGAARRGDGRPVRRVRPGDGPLLVALCVVLARHRHRRRARGLDRCAHRRRGDGLAAPDRRHGPGRPLPTDPARSASPCSRAGPSTPNSKGAPMFTNPDPRLAAASLRASGIVGGIGLAFLVGMFAAFAAGARSTGMTLGLINDITGVVTLPLALPGDPRAARRACGPCRPRSATRCCSSGIGAGRHDRRPPGAPRRRGPHLRAADRAGLAGVPRAGRLVRAQRRGSRPARACSRAAHGSGSSPRPTPGIRSGPSGSPGRSRPARLRLQRPAAA